LRGFRLGLPAYNRGLFDPRPGAPFGASGWREIVLNWFLLWSSPVFISSAFAQTAPAAAGGDMQSSLMSMLPLVLMFVVLYFVMIRPQMKKQKEHKAMIDAIAKGDEVVTAGGVLGKIAKLGESYVGLEVASGVEVQIQRSAIVQVLPKGTIK
jgi:preprotein translocase subunit YajC